MRKGKVLITGCRGMLGTALMETISGATGIDIEDADISDRKEIFPVIEKQKPAIVIHTAAYTNVDSAETEIEKAYSINAIGAAAVAMACKQSRSSMVYISTDYIFDGKNIKAYREDDTPNPQNVYGRSKLCGEIFVKDILNDHFIVRSSWLYGKGGKNFVDTIIKTAGLKDRIEVVDDQVGSPTSVIELSRAIEKLINTKKYGTYNVTCNGSCSWFDFAKKIVEMKKLKCEIVPVSSANYQRPAKRPSNSMLDNWKFRKKIGYRTNSWDNSLKEYIDAC